MLSQELLDKDWGAKVPDYITKGTFSIAVFFMSLTMRGDWIMFLAHYWRSQETTLPAGHHHQPNSWSLCPFCGFSSAQRSTLH